MRLFLRCNRIKEIFLFFLLQWSRNGSLCSKNQKSSKAKETLYHAILEGTVPLGDKKCHQMSLEHIYSIDPELSLYDFGTLKGRLNRLCDKLLIWIKRAEDDLLAFENYKKNHKPSLHSHKAYNQWQSARASGKWILFLFETSFNFTIILGLRLRCAHPSNRAVCGLAPCASILQ